MRLSSAELDRRGYAGDSMSSGAFKPNLLAIVPPYAIHGPPAGAAALLAYLKAAGCRDFGFLDLRLFAPDVATPTYRMTGAFGESFVLDIPDLPLVLAVLENVRRGRDPLAIADDVIEPYCVARGINTLFVRSYLQRMAGLVANVFDAIPDLAFIGFSTWTSNYLTTLLAAAHLKHRARPPFIVAGGPQVSQSAASAQLGLRSGLFDAVAVGEGEETLLDLYEHYSPQQRALTAPVAGALVDDPDAGGTRYAERPLLRLKELPLPDFDEMHLPAYRIGGKQVATYQLSRGCTDKCSFCSEWVFWRHFRLSRMDKAVIEVAELQLRWGIERLWFTDSLLNGQMNRLRDFATGLLEAGVEIEWSGYMRAQMDAPTADLLHRAGCRRVFIGVESLADETLRLMNKRMTETQNLAAVQAFLDAGIEVKVGLIPGFPGDTRERFVRTATHLRRMQEANSRLAVSHEAFVVLPGQPIYQDLASFGLTRLPWLDDVIAICPDLAEISRNVGWRIEGANQGMDRVGEHAISLSLVGPAHPTDRDADETHEALSLFRLDQAPLAAGVWLARTLAPNGHIVGAIITEDERVAFAGDRRRPGLAQPTGNAPNDAPTPICETPAVAAWLDAVLARHHARVALPAPRVAPAKSRALTPELVHACADTLSLTLGPFTIARMIDDALWLADIATGEAERLPATDATAAAILRSEDAAAAPAALALADLGLLVHRALPDDVAAIVPARASSERARVAAAPV
jgi:hypothetical protein